MASGGVGLSGLFDQTNLNLNKVQARLKNDVARLSSGLRVNTAADDPSGLAISESLQARASGLDTASENVQTANNALTVAEAALSTVTDILQRMRSISVEANNDLISSSDRGDLQNEIQQLLLEIDKIGENTTFNGVQLLNLGGPPIVPTPPPPVQNKMFTSPDVGPGTTFFSYQYNPPGATWTFSAPHLDGGTGITAFGSGNNFTYTNPQLPPSGSPQVAFVQGDGAMSQSIPGFASGQAYVLTFDATQRARGAFNHQQQSFSILVDGLPIDTVSPTPADFFNPDWISITTAAFIPGPGTHTITFQGLTAAAGENTAFVDNVNLVALPPARNPNLQVHDSSAEGDTVGIYLPSVSTSSLKIATNDVSSSTTATASETSVDAALTAIGSTRAELGAQILSLQHQLNANNVASVSATASSSAIRDANIGATQTAYVRDMLLSSIGTSIVANVRTAAKSVLTLFQR